MGAFVRSILLAPCLLATSVACVESVDAPPAEPQAPRDPHEDTWTPQSPQPKWWEQSPPCPEGSKLVGAPPPKGQSVECIDQSGKLNGGSSHWFGSGHAGTFGEYQAGVPHGRWLYWIHGQKLIEGAHDQGRRQGPWTFWFDDAATFDTTARMSTQEWSKNYVVEEYDHGLLVATKHIKDGKPID